MIDAAIDRFCRAIDLLIAGALAVMVVLVFGNVVLRYAFNSGIAVSEEVSRWLFVWLCFLGAVSALKEGGHLGTDMLVSRLPVGGKKACMLLGHLLMLYVTWLFLEGSWQQARINLDMEAPVTGASMAIFYGSGVVFSVCAGLLLLLQLVRLLTGRIGENELVMVKESEEQAELESLQAELASADAQQDPARVQSASGTARDARS
ncbi:C4-dicarboxylate ABC transporter permease [Roseateles chitinivorans]|uniref:TRAP transporter small permease protein n=1 Tax=Roseateles chitinivorans TaxID=2917965 RepID=A0A2G9CGR7_9BURK|nr:TRAP transporter small permease [Roseateles chitinivorans]PIM54814.1 C4-dicarboxylate ABC transporter permease [Roseateles chitinivorans]